MSSGRPRGRPRNVTTAFEGIALPRFGLHEQAAERLKAMIVQGELTAGSPLPEAGLSAALGISRTPLREALKLLAAEGLVELRPNRSARVPDWDSTEILELFETLAGIERLGAELAAIRMADESVARLRSMQSELDRCFGDGRLSDYFALNQDIHRFIVEVSANRTLVEVHRLLIARAQWARLRALYSHGRWEESAAEHRALLAALEAREPVRAGEVARDHVVRTGKVIAAVLRERRAELRSAA